MPRVLVLLAPGAEEMETAIIVDVLRRAEVEVVLASLDGTEPVTCSRGLRIVPDAALSDVFGDIELSDVKFDADALVLPGGAGGAQRLAADERVGALLRAQWARGGIVAAICAAPSALARHGIAFGRRVTSHPSVRDTLVANYQVSDERVVEDGPLLSSQGPGTSFEFALALVQRLRGSEVAAKVRAPMML